MFNSVVAWLKADLKITPRPGEIAPGIVRPSYALAGLIAGKMLASPLLLGATTKRPMYSSKELDTTGEYYSERTWKDDRVSVTASRAVYRHHESGSCSWTVTLGGEKFIDFLHEDWSLIQEAWKKIHTLKDELERNKRDAEKQQRACDFIQKIFTTPEIADDAGCLVETNVHPLTAEVKKNASRNKRPAVDDAPRRKRRDTTSNGQGKVALP